MINFRLANNLLECASAFRLASHVFSKNTTDPEYKKLLWDMNGSIHPEQLMLACNKTDIIGLVRMIPSKMAWREHSYSLMGLSVICVEPSYQGKNVGQILLQKTLEYCDSMGIDASYLVARHAVDHFYTKFGFFGASSYPQLIIKQLEFADPTDIILKPHDANHHSNYLNFHHHAYLENLKVARYEADYWQKSFKRLSYLGLSFEEIWDQNKLIGYVLLGKDYIDEIAFADGTTDKSILASLNKIQNKFIENLTLRVPHQHQVVKSLTKCDVLFMSRQCLYGGHMLRWNKLNPDRTLTVNIGSPRTLEEKSYPIFALSKLDEI